jgi:uncharacterized metal-binding protein
LLLLIAFVCLFIIACGVSAVEETFIILRSENHQWQWPAFKVGLYSGMYLFLIFGPFVAYISWYGRIF